MQNGGGRSTPRRGVGWTRANTTDDRRTGWSGVGCCYAAWPAESVIRIATLVAAAAAASSSAVLTAILENRQVTIRSNLLQFI